MDKQKVEDAIKFRIQPLRERMGSEKKSEDQALKIPSAQQVLWLALSCKGVAEILIKNLEALSRQNLDPKLWEPVFLFKEEQKDCLNLIGSYFPFSPVLFLPKGKPSYEMRNLALEALPSGPAQKSLIYFIDEDVILSDKEHLSRLIALHQKNPSVTALGGVYLNHPDSSFWGRSYNWITWLWAKNQKGFMPAGNLSVKMKKAFRARFYSPRFFGWGGEEAYFLKSLQQEGHKTGLEYQLNAEHLASHSLKDFIKRAWVHGASLAFEKRDKNSKSLFFKEPAPFLIKLSAFFYLVLVRLSRLFYKIFK